MASGVLKHDLLGMGRHSGRIAARAIDPALSVPSIWMLFGVSFVVALDA